MSDFLSFVLYTLAHYWQVAAIVALVASVGWLWVKIWRDSRS